MDIYKGKKVLVAGGTGLIGRPLVDMLLDKGAKVRISSLDDPSRANPEAEFMQLDLTKYGNCEEVCDGQDFVFNLLGIKGSPKMTMERPASFFESMILFNTNMMKAARETGAERYLFTSTIGVYSPAEVFNEEDVWETFPSRNDWFGGWAKRMGELQGEAYAIEHGWDKIAIVRPANVYGPYDNFDPANAMVIPSLIKRAMDGENPFTIWGDGSPTRDFIYTDDVAEGMMMALENCPGPKFPLNLGCGKEYSIKNLVDIIVDNLDEKPTIKWDTSKPTGDKKRLMNIGRAESIGWKPRTSLEEGVRKTMDWYKENKSIIENRYNVFKDKS
ncbi:NAD-dependent epimerase/dehydratase family protein [archaeon]|jgi:GDP-L-fucose synthase|nr:NAD-dependent epimerase/dehydratase family protein [archaeon]